MQYIAGVDEAGRGPLAGPVVAGAVIFPPRIRIPKDLIRDSKKMSAKQREIAYQWIITHALSYGIGIVNHLDIDRINILQATFVAMRQAIAQLKPCPDKLLVDGNCKIPEIKILQEAIVKGDAKIPSISAASIIAKVTRDMIMDVYDREYPGYNFRQHKGYPSKEHRDLVVKLGTCPIHRRSFLKTIMIR